jgi:hypothetical protein
MGVRTKVLVGSLTGAVAIHAAFVACGGGGGRRDALTSHDGGILDAMLDAIANVIDGTTQDAVAGIDGGSQSSASGPQGPLQTVPASENPAQLLRGTTSVSNVGPTVIVTGPFVLTDAMFPISSLVSGNMMSLTVATTSTGCSSTVTSATAYGDPGLVAQIAVSGATVNGIIHGGRYFVAADQTLCAYGATAGAGNLLWAGFRPY